MITNLVVLQGKFYTNKYPLLLDVLRIYHNHLQNQYLNYFNGRIDYFYLGNKCTITRKGTFKIYITNGTNCTIYSFLKYLLEPVIQNLASSLNYIQPLHISKAEIKICNVHFSGSFNHTCKSLLNHLQNKIKKYEDNFNYVEIYDPSGLSCNIALSVFIEQKTILYTSIVLKEKQGGTFKVQITGSYTLILQSLKNINFWKKFLNVENMNFSPIDIINPFIDYLFSSSIIRSDFFNNLVELGKITAPSYQNIKDIWLKELVGRCIQSYQTLKSFMYLSNKKLGAYNFIQYNYAIPVFKFFSDYLNIDIRIVSDNSLQCLIQTQHLSKFKAPHTLVFNIENNKIISCLQEEIPSIIIPSVPDKKHNEIDAFLDSLGEVGIKSEINDYNHLDEIVEDKSYHFIQSDVNTIEDAITSESKVSPPEIDELHNFDSLSRVIEQSHATFENSDVKLFPHIDLSDEQVVKIVGLGEDDIESFKNLPGILKEKYKLHLYLIDCTLSHTIKLIRSVSAPSKKCFHCPEHCLDLMKKNMSLPRGRKKKNEDKTGYKDKRDRV